MYIYIYIYMCIYIYICNPGHRVSRPRGTGSVGDSVGEGSPLGAVSSARRSLLWAHRSLLSSQSLLAVFSRRTVHQNGRRKVGSLRAPESRNS